MKKDFKIVYYFDKEFPSSAASTRQVAKTVDAIHKQGFYVELFVPVPFKNQKVETRIQNIKDYYTLSQDLKIREIKFPLPILMRKNKPIGIQRVPLSYFAIEQLKGYDVVCLRNFRHLKIALKKGLKVLYETFMFKTVEKRNKKIAELSNLYPNFIGIVTHSDLVRNYLISFGVKPEKITTVHNGIDESEIPVFTGKSEAREKLGISPETKLISYTGNIGSGKGVETILEVAKFLPDFTFFLIGAREKKDVQRLENFAKKNGVKNFKIFSWLLPREVYVYLFASDAIIIPPTAKPLMQAGTTVLPIKTFVYLASGIPILAPKLEDTAEIFVHKENAFLLTPDFPEKSASEINELFANQNLMEKISANALEFSKDFTWENRGKKIIDFIQKRFS
ncbi:glycosyltransferase family 4 protein [bacterium]|nr:glycosyltransferase family 4 protein [bacterium]